MVKGTTLAGRIRHKATAAADKLRAATWAPYSRLILADDQVPWVISWEMRELAAIARRLDIRVAGAGMMRRASRQAIFVGSQFDLMRLGDLTRHRVGFSYFHGRPGSGPPEFDSCYQFLREHHDQICRIQVSHAEMHNIVLDSGIDRDKVFTIPIGVNPHFFTPRTAMTRAGARERLGIPQSAVVVGSFQKDGNGWGDGSTPKLIKGPDIFLRVIEQLRPRCPELFVLLSGPARGYVIAGLERLNVPYKHIYLQSYPEISELYHALDLYLVTARQEGGPKAVLEAMASGVPLVTTRVGQAMDLVRHGENAWMVEVEDVEGLAHWSEQVLLHQTDTMPVVQAGLLTAAANTYEALTPRWRELLKGFVACAAGT